MVRWALDLGSTQDPWLGVRVPRQDPGPRALGMLTHGREPGLSPGWSRHSLCTHTMCHWLGDMLGDPGSRELGTSGGQEPRAGVLQPWSGGPWQRGVGGALGVM